MQPSKTTLLIRRERVFLILSGIFLCAMTMLNLLGITRFIELGPWTLAVGVLPTWSASFMAGVARIF